MLNAEEGGLRVERLRARWKQKARDFVKGTGWESVKRLSGGFL